MLQNASFLLKNCENRLGANPPLASGGWGISPQVNVILNY